MGNRRTGIKWSREYVPQLPQPQTKSNETSDKKKRFVWYVRTGGGVRSPFILPTKTTASKIAPAPVLLAGISGLFSRAKCNIPQARVKFAEPSFVHVARCVKIKSK